MSSSDEDNRVTTKKGGKKTDKHPSSKVEYQIKPSNGAASMDTSNWPLLLKVKPNITHIYNNLILCIIEL